jgi:hypothetical protein
MGIMTKIDLSLMLIFTQGLGTLIDKSSRSIEGKCMSTHNRSHGEFKYIAGVFLKTGIVTIAWFALAGGLLNTVSERIAISCERDEESLATCRVTTKHLVGESHLDLPAGSLQQIGIESVPYNQVPQLTKWQVNIVSETGSYQFLSQGKSSDLGWTEFGDRVNKFLDAPQQRTFAIESDYSFWFKLLNPAISGISIIVALFFIPGLLLTLKHGSDALAMERDLDFASKKIPQPRDL